MKHEEQLQMQVCNWLKIQHPKVMFTCDLSSGMKLRIGQAVKATKMRSSRGMPDLMIFEPRGHYHGLFIELKRVSVRVTKQDGTLVADKHIREQSLVLMALEQRGYKAVFGIGFYRTIGIINKYFSNGA